MTDRGPAARAAAMAGSSDENEPPPPGGMLSSPGASNGSRGSHNSIGLLLSPPPTPLALPALQADSSKRAKARTACVHVANARLTAQLCWHMCFLLLLPC